MPHLMYKAGPRYHIRYTETNSRKNYHVHLALSVTRGPKNSFIILYTHVPIELVPPANRETFKCKTFKGKYFVIVFSAQQEFTGGKGILPFSGLSHHVSPSYVPLSLFLIIDFLTQMYKRRKVGI